MEASTVWMSPDVLVFFEDLEFTAAGDTAGAHAAGNNCSVAGHAAAHGQNALSGVHTLDILGGSLLTDQDDTAACSVCGNSVVSVEIDTACSCAGGCRKSFADLLAVLESGSVEYGVQQLIEGLGFDSADCFLGGDHAFINEIAGDLDSSVRGALAVSGLQEEELAFLDGELHVLHIAIVLGELHVLHIAIVLLELVSDGDKLLVALGKILLQLGDLGGSADTCNDVFTLSIDQVLAEDTLCACSGVTCERNAGTTMD